MLSDGATISIIIGNKGNAATNNGVIKYSVDYAYSNKIDEYDGDLEAGESSDPIELKVERCMRGYTEVVVDPENDIEEENEKNNSSTVQ